MRFSPGEWRREIDWQLKRALPWSRPVRKRPTPLSKLQTQLSRDARYRFEQLREQYDLKAWDGICTPIEHKESLYVLDLLDRHVPKPPRHLEIQALDVGSKSWPYLPGLYSWLSTSWTGVELDAHVRYLDFTTRRAHGETMAAHHPGCRYLAENVLNITGQYDVITWLLPFVTPAPLESWGLPARFFAPERMLQHIHGLLAPGGCLFISHNTQAEARAQAVLLDQCNLNYVDRLSMRSPFAPERERHPGWLVKKQGWQEAARFPTLRSNGATKHWPSPEGECRIASSKIYQSEKSLEFLIPRRP